MATDAHHNVPESGPLADNKPTDMPATRTLFVVIAALLVVFAIVAAVMNFNSQEETPAFPPDGETGQMTE
ncbi:MAG: hypothetical protein KBA60_13365 [Flavobacteriales bacterium]|nr:hypothetical protein [Flavobacteriales bacterium]MBP6643187.1 hypothetical protein [Flavobacteriales bacterium]MBP7156996.1 hypothetical protein [Flavobacteriales bacterium]HQV75932.1 hypothetical protein [Flavobacteriales bacterium]HQW41653.1 hypothetical protein [Flavobacteriales bacterium]